MTYFFIHSPVNGYLAVYQKDASDKIGLFDASVSTIGGLPGSGAYSVCGPELAIEIGVVGKTAPEGCLLGGDTGAQQLLNVL